MIAYYKAMEERRNKRGHRYCIETTTGRRTPCPPKAGASPLKNDESSQPTTPERIVSGDTPTSGKVRKRGDGAVKAPSASEAKRPKGQATPEQKARPTNPKFADTNQALAFVEAILEGDGVALDVMSDWQQETGTTWIPDIARLRDVAKDTPGLLKQSMRNFLYNKLSVMGELGLAGLEGADTGRAVQRKLEQSAKFPLDWNDPDQYEAGKIIQALGWDNVSWVGKGAPPTKPSPQPRVPPYLPHGFHMVRRPKGSVPIARNEDGEIYSAVAPSREALNKHKMFLGELFDYVKGYAEQHNNSIPTALLARRALHLNPKLDMVEFWAAIRQADRDGGIGHRPMSIAGGMYGLYGDMDMRTSPTVPSEDGALYAADQLIIWFDRRSATDQ